MRDTTQEKFCPGEERNEVEENIKLIEYCPKFGMTFPSY